MALSKLVLLAGSLAAALVAPTSARAVHDKDNNALAASVTSDVDECRLPPVLDPSADGLPNSDQLWGNRWALQRQVERHQAIVRVPSVCYDDLGPIGEDPRWAPFDELHRVLRRTYPALHNYAKVERINKYGLVYTVPGADPSLKPILLTAHQDVVPVQDEDAWTYPPFEGYYDGQFLWGRGASDDKNSLTALLTTLEVMLTQVPWRPRRTVVLAAGFDEECSGYRGAARINEVLMDRYGEEGVAIILDEGGLGVQDLGDVVYVLPAVAEKGYLDVWFDLEVGGGHSSVPPPNTAIGIMSELVSELEANPYEPVMTRESPTWAHLACIARYSPDEIPDVTRLVHAGDLDGLAELLAAGGAEASGAHPFSVRTSQAVDIIFGGGKINALPEKVTLGVNYRVTRDDGIDAVMHRVVKLIEPIVERRNLSLSAFEHDGGKYHPGVTRVGGAGKISIRADQVSEPVSVSPMSGKVWDTFAGSARHSLRFDGTVVPVGEIMTGNTDTRHYLDLSPNIYRFTPAKVGSSAGVHTIDERVDMREHMKMLGFYYDLIRNFDRVVLDDERRRRPWSADEGNEEL
ncbi:Peptidase M20, carboxypeptidase S [Cordyceps fumosorosea ARSEF 2679]|uniref:Peptidase M20, carboxypeptidase S n=1 Tax=Cordyceps fumosorosea (strain ARSEF 2679) TaxID=1081104 RepID=A0A167NMQ1_CORFA|nr:Peptidase M20, carboxypeptidase S [Cordyceps fumosorosea ARSEF 2679]OAA55724.1 Peptidase M20, carboxypeptidase S [Cordyceps fumosorosea ARSEF 2679]